MNFRKNSKRPLTLLVFPRSDPFPSFSENCVAFFFGKRPKKALYKGKWGKPSNITLQKNLGRLGGEGVTPYSIIVLKKNVYFVKTKTLFAILVQFNSILMYFQGFFCPKHHCKPCWRIFSGVRSTMGVGLAPYYITCFLIRLKKYLTGSLGNHISHHIYILSYPIFYHISS